MTPSPIHCLIGVALIFASVWTGLASSAGSAAGSATAPDGSREQVDINGSFQRKLELYRMSLPEQLQARVQLADIQRHLAPALRFVYMDSWLRVLEHGFVVPELGLLFVGEAAQLFGNITYFEERPAEFPLALSLQLLLATLKSFEPTRFTTLLTAYPVCRRAVTAFVLEQYLLKGGFSAEEGALVVDISKLLFHLHKQAASTKRIIEFFHVSKSGGTSFCQLGRMNGCKTEGFDFRQNCMISYFRDAPRWTAPGALGNLSATSGDPWCARFGRTYSHRWHCRSRRQLLTKMRFNFYSNELVMHDHNRSWTGVHPCREFLNVVIFREPETRIYSHLQNIIKEYVNYYNETLWQHFNPGSADQWRALAVPVLDNYVIRSLLGGTAYNWPYGSVNATHLLAAKIVALQFEVLLSLTPQTSELTRDIFGLGLGWHYDLRHLHARSTNKRAYPEFSPAVDDLVRTGAALDQELYEFALVLQLLDALAFGVAHDVAGVGVGGAPIDAAANGAGAAKRGLLQLAIVNATSWLQQEQQPIKLVRKRRMCGYVGIKRKLSEKPPPPPPSTPALEAALGVASEGIRIEGLGKSVIAGGRWWNGVFYHNASVAENAAVTAARAAAAAIAAAMVAEAADAAAAVAAAGGMGGGNGSSSHVAGGF